jgi:PII-like signaling protein
MGDLLQYGRLRLPEHKEAERLTAKISGTAERIRIFIGEGDRYGHQPLYHAIVVKARQLGMAGATVTRALEGFGAASRIKTANLLDLSSDLPVVIEIVDSKEYIDRFLPVLEEMVSEGMITRDPVEVIKYAHRPSTPPHVDPPKER